MGEIADVKLGGAGDLKLKFEGGKLVLAVELGADQILTLVENAIPGDLDNKIIDGLKLLLLKY